MVITATLLLPWLLFASQPEPFAFPARGAALPYEFVVCQDIAELGASWYYDWDWKQPCDVGAEFVPMVWNVGQVEHLAELPDSVWLLGPNEPNYAGQGVATPADVAAVWPLLEATGRALASPAVSACENPDAPACLNPTWLEEWAALCQDCRYEAVALHWYGCDVAALAAYLDMRHAQFPEKEIWLTEFACGRAGDPGAFMAGALEAIRARAFVTRYAWFATRTGLWPGLMPLVDDGGLTELGYTYIGQMGYMTYATRSN